MRKIYIFRENKTKLNIFEILSRHTDHMTNKSIIKGGAYKIVYVLWGGGGRLLEWGDYFKEGAYFRKYGSLSCGLYVII